MASNRIKGITIELDGETTGLEKALKSVNSKSVELQSELRDVDRLLKFDPGNIEALSQKQKILTQHIENTSEKLKALRDAQEDVEKQYQSGNIGEKQYRSFRREIEYTETSLKGLKDKLGKIDDNSAVLNVKKDFSKMDQEVENASESVKELSGELTNLIAGAAAGKGLSEVIGDSLDLSKLNTKIDLTFDIPESDLKSVKESINVASSYGIDAEEALEGIRRQFALNSSASTEFNTEITKSAAAIASAYSGVDFTELIQEAQEFSKALDLSNEYTLGLFNSLLKVGFPPEQLDIISEYGSQLARVGYTAEEIQGIFEAAANSGTNNIDQLLDGIKEGRIKLAEFGQGIDETTAGILNSVGISAEQFQQWGINVANGGLEGKEAMVQVAEAIKGIDDEVLKNQAGVLVYGTLWEEQGSNITSTLIGANQKVIDLEANQQLLNEGIESLDSTPAIQMEQAMASLKTSLEPLLEIIANIISKVAEWISNNPTLAATITAIIITLGILIGIFLALSPIITALSAATGVLGISMGAIAAPVLIIIGVITALIAIGVALWKNWDTITAKASEIFNNVKETITNAFENVINFLSGIDLFEIGTNIIEGLVDGIKSMIGKVTDTISNIASTITGGIKNLLGIHSPSRVMMEMGEYTGEGFAIGLGSTIGDISNKAKDMTRAVKDNISGISGYGTGVNSTDRIASTITTKQTIVVPVNLEGKPIATVTAPYQNKILGNTLAFEGRSSGL